MFAAAVRRLATVAATGVRTYASEAGAKKGVSCAPRKQPHPPPCHPTEFVGPSALARKRA